MSILLLYYRIRSLSLHWFTLLLKTYFEYIIGLKRVLESEVSLRAVNVEQEEKLEVLSVIIKELKKYKKTVYLMIQKSTGDYISIKGKEFYDLIDIITN